MKSKLLLSAVLANLSLASLVAGDLEPLMSQPDKVVLREDFSKSKKLDKAVWRARQGTRWAMEDGVLRGRPSSPEYQARKADHKGLEPRLSIPAAPQEFIIEFSIRIVGGEPTPIVPFVEFGHHVARVNWNKGGARLLANGESVRLAAAPEFHLKSGEWRRALAEIQGDEFVIQFASGATLFGAHEAFAGKKDGFGVAGLRGGVIELDDITIWSVKPKKKAYWAAIRAKLPQSRPVKIEKRVRRKKRN